MMLDAVFHSTKDILFHLAKKEIMHDTNIIPNTPEQQTALFKSLIAAVSETKDIHADSVNPHFKSKYASLSKHIEVLKPIFAKHGLAVIQLPCGNEAGVGVRTFVIHKDGGCISAEAIVPADKGMQGQHAGAIYSYVRRYAIASVAGCATDDDDAELDRMLKEGKSYNPKPSAPAPSAIAFDKPKAQSFPSSAPAGGNSGEVVVPFGDRKGQPLSSLPLVENDRSIKFGDLTYFAKRWTPKPYGDNPNPSARDLKVKAEAERLFSLHQANGDDKVENTDDVPY